MFNQNSVLTTQSNSLECRNLIKFFLYLSAKYFFCWSSTSLTADFWTSDFGFLFLCSCAIKKHYEKNRILKFKQKSSWSFKIKEKIFIFVNYLLEKIVVWSKATRREEEEIKVFGHTVKKYVQKVLSKTIDHDKIVCNFSRVWFPSVHKMFDSIWCSQNIWANKETRRVLGISFFIRIKFKIIDAAKRDFL